MELPRLYAITDSKGTENFEETLRKVLDRGVRMIQLREKELTGRKYYELALRVREITREYSALLFINERVDVALAVHADGVHLPERAYPQGDKGDSTETFDRILCPQLGISPLRPRTGSRLYNPQPHL